MATTRRLRRHSYHGVLVDPTDLHLRILSFARWYSYMLFGTRGLVDNIPVNIELRVLWLT